jgi:predicted dehydrogenase
MTVPPLSAALLGLQHPHSDTHLQTLLRIPEVAQVIVWDSDAAAICGFLAKQSALHQTDYSPLAGSKVVAATSDLAELLAHDWSFAIGALRTDHATTIYPQLFAAGRHLLAEKPLGRDSQEAAFLVDQARAANVKLGVCYVNRANPVVQAARQIVAEGLLGPLISVEARAITTQVQFRNPGSWLFDRKLSGGGMLSWLGCHQLDMIRFITGDEIAEMMAHIATRSGEAITVEDVATCSFQLRSGALGSLHTGYMMALSGGGYHNKQGYDNYFAVNGRTGRLFWSSPGAPTEFYVESAHPTWAGAPQRTFRYNLAPSPAYLGVYGEHFVQEFVHAIHGEGALPASGEDALQIARIVDAAYASSESGLRVSITDWA